MQICEFKFFYDNNWMQLGTSGSEYGELDDGHMCEWFIKFKDAYNQDPTIPDGECCLNWVELRMLVGRLQY